MALFPIRILIFNLLYAATIKGMQLYDVYEYGEQAMHGWAHAGVAIFIFATLMILNVIYFAVELVFWGCGFWKTATPVFQLIFSAASYVAILGGYLVVVFLSMRLVG